MSETVGRSQSSKANLTYPVGRICSKIRAGKYTLRISKETSIIMTAMLEYLSGDILDRAAQKAKAANKKRITSRHINLAIRMDDNLHLFFKDEVIVGGGVMRQRYKVNRAPRKKRRSKNVGTKISEPKAQNNATSTTKTQEKITKKTTVKKKKQPVTKKNK